MLKCFYGVANKIQANSASQIYNELLKRLAKQQSTISKGFKDEQLYFINNIKLFNIEQRLNILNQYDRQKIEIPEEMLQFTKNELASFQPRQLSQFLHIFNSKPTQSNWEGILLLLSKGISLEFMNEYYQLISSMNKANSMGWIESLQKDKLIALHFLNQQQSELVLALWLSKLSKDKQNYFHTLKLFQGIWLQNAHSLQLPHFACILQLFSLSSKEMEDILFQVILKRINQSSKDDILNANKCLSYLQKANYPIPSELQDTLKRSINEQLLKKTNLFNFELYKYTDDLCYLERNSEKIGQLSNMQLRKFTELLKVKSEQNQLSERLINSIRTMKKSTELTPSNQLRFSVLTNEDNQIKQFLNQSHLFDIKDVVFMMTILKNNKPNDESQKQIMQIIESILLQFEGQKLQSLECLAYIQAGILNNKINLSSKISELIKSKIDRYRFLINF